MIVAKMRLEHSKQALVVARILLFFAPKCRERSTLDELIEISLTASSWPRGRQLFERIRKKTLDVERELKKPVQLRRRHFQRLEHQYLLEEVCAKTLYNLSGWPAPYDLDSPDWIVPNAVSLANAIGIEDSAVLDIVAKTGQLDSTL